jgi:hypothetical protein
VYETISERDFSVTTSESPERVPPTTEPSQPSRMTVADFEARIRRYNSDLEPGSVSFRAAVILLASQEYGHNIDRIARRTGFDRGFVARVARRLIDNGVWNAGVTVADWSSSDEASGTFWNDVAVAEGKMCRRIGPGGQIEWAPAGFWNKNFQYVVPTGDRGLSTQYLDATQIVDKSDVDKSAAERDEAFLTGDDAGADPLETAMTSMSKTRPEPVETRIVGPLPGVRVTLPTAARAMVPPLDDLFRDVVWIG